eukprot:3602487-Pyramimonas_sp.AAC.1
MGRICFQRDHKQISTESPGPAKDWLLVKTAETLPKPCENPPRRVPRGFLQGFGRVWEGLGSFGEAF